jgi:hypothetical protein
VRGRPSRFRLIAAAAAALGAFGCRDELGPERFPTATVSGVVLKSGEPIPGGWVEFLPTDGTAGHLRTARIEPDGTFRADGVAVGPNVVHLVDAPGLPPGGAAVLSNTAAIRREVAAGSNAPMRIDAIEELLRYQKTMSSATPSPREGGPRP